MIFQLVFATWWWLPFITASFIDLRTELWASGCSKRLWLGDQVLPNDPLLVMNPMASLLVGNCLVVVVAIIFPSLLSCSIKLCESEASFMWVVWPLWTKWSLPDSLLNFPFCAGVSDGIFHYQLTYAWGANLKRMPSLLLGNRFLQYHIQCFKISVRRDLFWSIGFACLRKCHHLSNLLPRCRLGLMCWLLKPKMHLFKHTLHRTKMPETFSCNKLFLKSFGHLVLRFAVVLGHFILGMNSRHWHCFSEEDSIGMIKKVSATVSGRFMEKFLIKVARLRPEFRKNALFFCLVLVKSWKKIIMNATSLTSDSEWYSLKTLGWQVQKYRDEAHSKDRCSFESCSWQLFRRFLVWLMVLFCRTNVARAWARWWFASFGEKSAICVGTWRPRKTRPSTNDLVKLGLWTCRDMYIYISI